MKLQPNLKYSPTSAFQIWQYTEGGKPPSTDLWRLLGTTDALQLPMVVTLKDFKLGYRYHFAVRGVDQLKRFGEFNEPKALDLRDIIPL